MTTKSTWRSLAEQRQEELADDVGGERRAVAAPLTQPPYLRDEAAELAAEVVEQRLERGEQPGLAGLAQPQLPVDQLGVGLGPLAPVPAGTPRLVFSSRKRCANSRATCCCWMLSPSSSRVTTESTCRGEVGFTR
jgi:hypothetical protein